MLMNRPDRSNMVRERGRERKKIQFISKTRADVPPHVMGVALVAMGLVVGEE